MKTLTIKILSILVITILSINIMPANSFIEIKPLSEVKQQSLWISENTYQVKPGTVEIYSGSMAFLNSTGQYERIDTTIQQNSTYYYGIKGIYKFYISKNLNVSYPFIIIRGNSSLLWKPVNAGYLDKSNYKIQVLRNLNLSSKPMINGSSILYPQLFGRNTNFKITVGTDEFKEELLINQGLVFSLPSPSNYGMLTENTFVGIISNFNKINLNFNNSNMNYSTVDTVSFNYNSMFKLGLPPASAWDSQTDELGKNNNSIQVRNIFTFKNGVNKIASGVPYNWIKASIGEVTIDPTVTIQPASIDTYMDGFSAVYLTARNQASATSKFDTSNEIYAGQEFYSLNYKVYRMFLNFNTTLPASSILLDVKLELYGFRNSTSKIITPVIVQHTGGYTSFSLSDYSKTGTQGGNLLYTSKNFTTTGWNVYTFNSTGISWINKTGTTRLAMRTTDDINAVAPTGAYENTGYLSSDYSTDTTKRPKLVITYEVNVYLTVYIHTGISALYLNGSSKSNGTSTSYPVDEIANITSVTSAGYDFLYYKFNSTYFTTSNPLYWTMNKNYTVNAYAYQVITTTTTITSTSTITTTVTSNTTITSTSTITSTITSTTTSISTSTTTSTTILQNIVCANTTTTTTRSYIFFDGFESGNFVKWNNTAEAHTGKITVTSVKPINGSYSEHVSIGSNINGYGYAVGKANLTSLGNNIWMQLFIRVDNFTHTPNKEFHFLSLRNTTSGSAGAFIRMGIKHLTAGEHILEVEVNTPSGLTDYETGDLDILNNSVTRIELGLFKDSTNGYIEAFVNGSRVINLQHIKTNYPAFTLNNFRVGVTATGNGMRDFNVTIDDVAFDGSRIGLPPFTCIYVTNIFTTGIQVLPNNEIPNLFYFGVFGGIIFIFLIIAILARRRN